MTPTTHVKMSGISKSFGGVEALSDVDFEVEAGEIVGLLGDNGAGKTTLIKILSGALRPDAGEITVRDKPVHFRGTRDAIAAGIETIHQGATLVDQLTVSRNLFLGREPTRRILGFLPRLDWPTMREESRTLLSQMGLHRTVDPDGVIASLSGGERQSVAISRAMYFESDLIILDEPTNNLGLDETRRVLSFIREAKAAGRSIVFITHNVFHVFQVVDRIVVLRHGRNVGNVPAAETSVEEVERMITGVEAVAQR